MISNVTKVGPRLWPPCPAFSERKLEYVAQNSTGRQEMGENSFLRDLCDQMLVVDDTTRVIVS
jgi:hypothetical protein